MIGPMPLYGIGHRRPNVAFSKKVLGNCYGVFHRYPNIVSTRAHLAESMERNGDSVDIGQISNNSSKKRRRL